MEKTTDTRRRLPGVDQVLRSDPLKSIVAHWGAATTAHAIRTVQADERESDTPSPWAIDVDGYPEQVERWLRANVGHGYETVFNLTGTVIHTNLGRALLSEAVMERAVRAATRPTTLEYDLATGRRGQRERIIEHRLKLLTGCEAATVVNNNAAAVVLVLNTFAREKSVLVSRGELIEIGGSFRLPDIMERAGCTLREVGTTNRTRAADYANAVDDDVRLILKVHPSNYHIEGFTESAGLAALATVGEQTGIPVAVDVGSGTLIDLTRFGLPHEPTPQEVLGQGADLVTFSGDKLLGGVQAGIIVGSSEQIDAIKRNPLKRALRADKITLAILDETLKAYEDPDRLTESIPLLRTLTAPTRILEERSRRLGDRLCELLPEYDVSVEPSGTQIGSGALPDQLLESRSVTVGHSKARAVRDLEARLRALRPAVIGRIQDDRLWLDVRCADPFDELLETIDQLQ